jgi:hypothetical protein
VSVRGGVGSLAKARLLLYIDFGWGASNYVACQPVIPNLRFTFSVSFLFEPYTNKRVKALEKK